MTRRLAALVLTAAMVLGGIVAGPCMSHAACALQPAGQMDCCKGAGTGIRAPRCCEGPRQLGSGGAPAVLERLVHTPPTGAPIASAPLAPVSTDRTQLSPARSIAHDAAPPSGTLIAQHTSLLL